MTHAWRERSARYRLTLLVVALPLIAAGVLAVGSGVASAVAAPITTFAGTTIPVAGALTIAATSPVGTSTMLVASGGGGTSYLDNDGAGHFTVRPGTPGPVYSGGIPGVAVGDVNGDSFPDFVSLGGDGPYGTLVYGGPGGSFSFGIDTFGVPDGSGAVAAGDVNGDGYADIAWASWGGSAVTIWLGKPLGCSVPGVCSLFDPGPPDSSTLPVGANPFSVAIGDLDGDGFGDVVTANGSSNSITVYRGSPAGPLAGSRADYATFSGGYPTPDALAIADVNGDGRPDVVAVGRFPGEVSTFLSNGLGGLDPAVVSFISGPPGTNWDPRAVAVADFNGDGLADIVTPIQGDANTGAFVINQAAVLYGDGTGSFANQQNFTVGMQPASVVTGDFDGDGRADFAVTNVADNTVTVMLNGGAPPDELPPVVTVPADVTVPTDPGSSTADLLLEASGLDNYDGPIRPTCAVITRDKNGNSIGLRPLKGKTRGLSRFFGRFPVGTWLVSCSATDLAGNTGSASFQVTVTADTTPPVVTVPAEAWAQAATASGATVTFDASASDESDGALTPDCSPASGSVLPLGTTTVTCTATDAGGNVGSASFPAIVTLVAITVAPPAESTSQRAAFSWSTVAFSRFTCSLDGALYAACSSPRTYNGLAAGAHRMCVRATADVAPRCYAWTIVSPGKPVVTIGPVSVIGRAATLSFTADQPAPRFTCSIDGAAYRSCSAPLTYNSLALGPHTVRVLATNFAGDTSAAPASATFTVV